MRWPYLLSLFWLLGASLLLFFNILCGASTGTLLKRWYWLEAGTENIPGAHPVTRWTSYNSCGVENGHNYDCTSSTPGYPVSPALNFKTTDGVPSGLTSRHGVTYYLTKVGWAFLLIGLFFTLLTLIPVLLGFCLPKVSSIGIGSNVSIMLALLFTTLSACLLTAGYVKARNDFRNAGNSTKLGQTMIAFLWTSVFLLFLSSIFSGVGCFAGLMGARREKRDRYSDEYNDGSSHDTYHEKTRKRGGFFSRSAKPAEDVEKYDYENTALNNQDEAANERISGVTATSADAAAAGQTGTGAGTIGTAAAVGAGAGAIGTKTAGATGGYVPGYSQKGTQPTQTSSNNYASGNPGYPSNIPGTMASADIDKKSRDLDSSSGVKNQSSTSRFNTGGFSGANSAKHTYAGYDVGEVDAYDKPKATATAPTTASDTGVKNFDMSKDSTTDASKNVSTDSKYPTTEAELDESKNESNSTGQYGILGAAAAALGFGGAKAEDDGETDSQKGVSKSTEVNDSTPNTEAATGSGSSKNAGAYNKTSSTIAEPTYTLQTGNYESPKKAESSKNVSAYDKVTGESEKSNFHVNKDPYGNTTYGYKTGVPDNSASNAAASAVNESNTTTTTTGVDSSLASAAAYSSSTGTGAIDTVDTSKVKPAVDLSRNKNPITGRRSGQATSGTPSVSATTGSRATGARAGTTGTTSDATAAVTGADVPGSFPEDNSNYGYSSSATTGGKTDYMSTPRNLAKAGEAKTAETTNSGKGFIEKTVEAAKNVI